MPGVCRISQTGPTTRRLPDCRPTAARGGVAQGRTCEQLASRCVDHRGGRERFARFAADADNVAQGRLRGFGGVHADHPNPLGIDQTLPASWMPRPEPVPRGDIVEHTAIRRPPGPGGPGPIASASQSRIRCRPPVTCPVLYEALCILHAASTYHGRRTSHTWVQSGDHPFIRGTSWAVSHNCGRSQTLRNVASSRMTAVALVEESSRLIMPATSIEEWLQQDRTVVIPRRSAFCQANTCPISGSDGPKAGGHPGVLLSIVAAAIAAGTINFITTRVVQVANGAVYRPQELQRCRRCLVAPATSAAMSAITPKCAPLPSAFATTVGYI